MYQLKIHLKQHTPLIHFQHSQNGATLRATEVKPKLDRYLIENEFGGILNFDEYKQYLIGDVAGLDKEWKKKDNDKAKIEWLQNQKLAFDYKLRISCSDVSYFLPLSLNPNSRHYPNKGRVLIEHIKNSIGINTAILAPAPYFANADKIKFNQERLNHNNTKVEELKLGLLANEPIHLTINTLSKSLLSLIEKHLAAFMVTSTFGNRNSKGFGCFSLASQSLDDVKNIFRKPTKFSAVFEKLHQGDIASKFNFIAAQYGKLKRGVSERRNQPYQKSLLWDYLCNNEPTNWEKKKIKTFLQQNHAYEFNQLRTSTNDHRIDTCKAADENSFKYVRSLLGLAEHFEFVKERGKLKVNISDTLSHREETKHLAVERFKSPLQYYIFNDTIFLLTTKIPEEFVYSIENNNKQIRQFRFTFKNLSQPNSFDIPVPEIFDLSDFIAQQTDFVKIQTN